ncbi:hypothetical protein BU16DRAFT_66453 [Lophium mytilinum]|uniref:Uncharacterized protein n=1 Tax=Lophium mytilinum TaxID=390894 RepID=A0A6A6QR17_9PEZI|nr:hypothetical protein BU16DRAFT_66453 [Lophium mytilinum]
MHAFLTMLSPLLPPAHRPLPYLGISLSSYTTSSAPGMIIVEYHQPTQSKAPWPSLPAQPHSRQEEHVSLPTQYAKILHYQGTSSLAL